VLWQNGFGQLVIGVLSNLLFVVVLTTAGVLYVRAVLARRSRPLRRLLGVDGRKPNSVRILVSSINVIPGGARGALGMRTGFHGPVMNQNEYVSALRLAEAIQSRPATHLLRALLDQLGLLDAAHDPIDCSISYSPQYLVAGDGATGNVSRELDRSLDESGVYILVGGPIYNGAVHHVLTNLGVRTRFQFDMPVDVETPARGIWVTGFHRNGDKKSFERLPSQDGAGADYFILQKISKFGSGSSTVFICSGLSSMATAMAVGMLARDWERLERKFHGDDFELLYRFRNDRDIPMPTAKDVDRALDAAATTCLWEHTVLPDQVEPVVGGVEATLPHPRAATQAAEVAHISDEAT
jgi:hypothetical protein